MGITETYEVSWVLNLIYYLGLDAHVEPTIYDGLVEFTWRQEPKPKD
jgi:hypothetical protein